MKGKRKSRRKRERQKEIGRIIKEENMSQLLHKAREVKMKIKNKTSRNSKDPKEN